MTIEIPLKASVISTLRTRYPGKLKWKSGEHKGWGSMTGVNNGNASSFKLEW